MNVYVDLRNLFDLFCIVQGVSTTVWLLLQPTQPANRWLALLLLGLTLQVTDYFLSRSGVYFRHRWLYFTPLFFSWGFGPLLYGYMQSRLTGEVVLPRRHFIPVLIQAIFYLVLSVQSLSVKAWFWQTIHKPYTRYVEYYVGCLLILYYLHLSWQLVQRSDTQKGLKRLLVGIVLFYLVALIDPLLNSVYLSPQDTKFFLTAQVLPLLAYSAALLGRAYPHRVHSQLQPQTRVTPLAAVNTDHQDLIRQAMQEKKLYRDPDLTLTSLAEQVGLSPHVLSRTINAGFGQSFTDFVNEYRINDVKQRLETGDTDRLTILALALEAGFASKTTFNRVFKEQTGLTPKAYEKRYQIIVRDDTTD